MVRTAGSAPALGVLAVALAACSSPSPADAGPGIPFDRAAMLANLGENILLPVYREFATGTEQLGEAVAAYCGALATPEEATRLVAAQDAWRAAMDGWQLAEVMLIGPAAMNERDLRDRIYSWPVTSSCAVDQAVMARRDDPAFDITAELPPRRGLDALEYLLFARSLEVTCPPQTAPPGWDALTDADRRAARCALAVDAATDLRAQAQVALDGWEPASGNFVGELAAAGQSGSSFATAQDAINVVSDSLFYLDSEVKDMKIAQPAGITLNTCNAVQEPCLAELESQLAHQSRDSIAANLRGFERVFLGTGLSGDDGLGFDEFLRAAGADALADAMTRDIADAIARIQAIPGPLDMALTDDYASVVAVHDAVKRITDNLKSQFLTVLGLDVPDSAAGDND